MSIRLQAVDLSPSGWKPTTLDQTNAELGVGGTDKKVLSTPVSALTSVALDGSGVFDKLMQTVKLHLQEEFAAQRITGHDYSTVYLGALSAVLQTSTQFLLNEQQANQINAEIGLIRQKTVTELAQTDDNIPAGLGFNFIPQEITPIPPVS